MVKKRQADLDVGTLSAKAKNAVTLTTRSKRVGYGSVVHQLSESYIGVLSYFITY